MATEVLYLIVEGLNNDYPRYTSNNIYLTNVEPNRLDLGNPFQISPIYPFEKDFDLSEIDLNNKKISFFIIRDPFPTFSIIKDTFQNCDLFFSIGLANLILIENSETKVSSEICSLLKENDKYIGTESWEIEEDSISNYHYDYKNGKSNSYSHDVPYILNAPNHLKFALTEYKLSVEKIIAASKKFAPHYYDDFKKIFNATDALIDEVKILLENKGIDRSPSLTETLDENNWQDILNTRLGTLNQLNSALSYVYSQNFSGQFPILHNNGLIRKYSLLGTGSAVAALFEILKQLEELFYVLQVNENFLTEDLETKSYATITVNNLEFIKPNEYLKESIPFPNEIYKLIANNIPNEYYSPEKQDDFFTRLAFFSGRLGFREYDFSATAALQVLVNANALQWNVINYSHEIIHNHVRLILNNIIGHNKISIQENLNRSLDLILNLRMKTFSECSIVEYIRVVIVSYIINTKYFGSLSKSFDVKSKVLYDTSENLIIEERLPSVDILFKNLAVSYKDLSEIFVHIIDFKYVYKSLLEHYITSIWSSWSIISNVRENLSHYVLRTLLIIALDIDGTTKVRFTKSYLKFKRIFLDLSHKYPEIDIYKKVLSLFNEESKQELNPFEIDLLFRFQNCITVADIVSKFFSFDVENYLDKNDKNILPKDLAKAKGEVYDIIDSEFENRNIESKLRFAFHLLLKSIHESKPIENLEDEYLSVWSLLALSSNYD